MSQQLITKFNGLYTHPSDLSSTPNGGLLRADDIVIDREDIASPRRGFDRVSYGLSNASLRLNKTFFYQDMILGHYGANKLAYYNSSSGWQAYSSTYAPIDSYIKTFVDADVNTTTDVITVSSHAFAAGDKVLLSTSGVLPAGLSAGTSYYVTTVTTHTFKLSETSGGSALDITAAAGGGTHTIYLQTVVPVRATQGNQNLYFTTSDGIYKLDAYNATPSSAGAYKGLDLTAVANALSASAWLPANYSVAYRLVWGYRDANNNLILGSPSQREVLTNGASIAAIDLHASVPAGVTTSWFYQLYRSASVDNTSGDVEPNDELGLIYEANPTTKQLTDSSFTVATGDIDTTAETLTETAHGLANGDIVTLSSSGTLPAGTAANTKYYVVNVTADTFKISATYGGTAINISSQGTGTHTVYYGGIIAIQDIVPDELRGATIYTAATQQGIAQANERPPMAQDITTYKNYTFFANTTGPHRFYLTMLGVGSPNGIQSADTVTIGGIVYTAAATEAVTSGNFKVSAAASAATKIKETARSLIRVINQRSTSTVYAYYLSGPDDLPGKILLEERGLGSVAFNVQSSRASAWSELTTNNTNVASTNDRFKNGLYFSKLNQPDAAPLPNTFFVGSANYSIKRIIPLRDSLFIFKDDGIFRLSGIDSTSFRVDLADSTTKILAPESVAVLNNQIFALSDQGVVAITDGGVQVKSRPIENTILSLLGVDLDKLRDLTFAVSYESERKYILFTITEETDTFPTQAYVYNTFTNTWVRWVLEKTCGGVNPLDDKLYLGDSDSSYLNIERKDYDFTDHADYSTTATISTVIGSSLTISNANLFSAGDVVYQSSSTYATITSINEGAGTIVVEYDAEFAAGAVTVYKSIPTKIQWIPISGGNPGAQKQFREVLLLFKTDFVGEASVIFSNDQYPSEETENIEGSQTGGWGAGAWGEVQWGGEHTRAAFRIFVPRNKQRCNQLLVEFNHNVGFSAWELTGISATFKEMSERTSNGTLTSIS